MFVVAGVVVSEEKCSREKIRQDLGFFSFARLAFDALRLLWLVPLVHAEEEDARRTTTTTKKRRKKKEKNMSLSLVLLLPVVVKMMMIMVKF